MAQATNSSGGFLAGGILLLTLAAMFAIAFAPHLISARLDGEIGASRDLLGTLNRQAASAPRLERENAMLKASGTAVGLLLPGATTGIAGADLQKRLAALVKRFGGTARSAQVLPAEQSDNLVKISLAMSFLSDTRGMRSILHALETGTPILFVEELSVQPLRARAGPTRQLSVSLQVSGYTARAGKGDL